MAALCRCSSGCSTLLCGGVWWGGSVCGIVKVCVSLECGVMCCRRVVKMCVFGR